jgi:hypothetical protein
MAAVHRVVLTGGNPELASFYPTMGGDSADHAGAWSAFRLLLAARTDEVRALVQRPCQTNEVGRSGALLGGFLMVVRATGLPLRLLEVGASAGLNLWWDRYRFEGSWGGWGDPTSPVHVSMKFDGEPPPLTPQFVDVATRRGCDANVLDPSNAEHRLTLLSSVWADQPDRFERLRAALDFVARRPLRVERARAWPWIAGQLAEAASHQATVVFHSVVMRYLPEDEWARFVDAIRAAGARATPAEPLAWLRMEAPDWRPRGHEIRVTLWPGGEERLLARTAPHGSTVEWLAR